VSEALLASLGRFVPEIVIIVTMMFLLYLEAAYARSEKSKNYMHITAAIGHLVALICLFSNLKMAPTAIFTNAVVVDPFSTFIKIIMVIGSLGVVWLNKESQDVYPELKGEFLIMTSGILAGGMILASANNMLMLYLGIETLSILSYVMASFKKNDGKSSEAGLKYVLYGGVSSGVMLFGMSHIFGMLGTIQFNEIIGTYNSAGVAELAILIPSFILFFVGLGYKIACVPFHMWSPDVYEGSPIPVTTFFAIVPKIAAMAVIVRVSYVFFGYDGIAQTSWIGLLTVISALTMTVGNVTAIEQVSIKRMLAFSSIGHAGLLLAGATVIDSLGYQSLLFYALSYVFMTLVAFYVVSFVSDRFGNDHFERFSGLVFKHPVMAIVMSLTMFSLAGIPPLSGFVAKYNILSALVSKGNFTLALIAAINSVVSIYYYLKVVRIMIFKNKESEEHITGFGFLNQMIIVAFSVPVVVLGIFWEKIMLLAQGASLYVK
jgi:NADH-quinone oxidoreductase subunit N